MQTKLYYLYREIGDAYCFITKHPITGVEYTWAAPITIKNLDKIPFQVNRYIGSSTGVAERFGTSVDDTKKLIAEGTVEECIDVLKTYRLLGEDFND